MNARSRLALATLAALAMFVAIVGGGLAIGHLSAPLDGRGSPSGNWMLGAFVIAVVLATAAVVAIGGMTRRSLMQVATRAHEAFHAQQRA